MAPRETRERLLHDRRQLLAALGEYRRGKAAHLAKAERESVVASIKRRIADLDAKIEAPDVS
jgi:hypothetical protein